VLDDVERRRFLVDPARENAAPPPVRLLDVELDEGARQFLFLPRRGRLAGAEANDHVLPADRLAGVQRDVLDDPVALVEDAEDRNALRHRRHSALARGGRGDGLRGRDGILLFGALAARRQRKRDQHGCGKGAHAYSGIQGS
jgi:hypothetical protein